MASEKPSASAWHTAKVLLNDANPDARRRIALALDAARNEGRCEREAELRIVCATLLSTLDAHEDAADPVFGEAYHRDHTDAVYAAKSNLRDAIKENA